MGAVPRRRADRRGRKALLFLKKRSKKLLIIFGFGPPGETEAEFAKFFGSFFQKRTAFCCLP
jgi:hypothetical protein